MCWAQVPWLWFLGAGSSLWVLRNLEPLSFLSGKDPRTHAPAHSPGTQIHRGLVSPPALWALSVLLESQVLPASRKKKGVENRERGNPDQTPDPSPHQSPGHLPYWAKEDFIRSLRAPGGGGWEQQKRAGGHCFLSMPQAKALSLDPTLSPKGYSTLLWEALAGHLLNKP